MRKGSNLIISIAAVGIFSILILSFGTMSFSEVTNKAIKEDQKLDIPKLFVPNPLPSEIFPCSKCHNYMPVNKQKRKLELNHSHIVLKHGDEDRWCYDCHEGDKLKLSNGKPIDYDKSYFLCGQCHGTVFKDWEAGIHGKRTGMWNGEKLYRLCVNCHDPHQPRFKPLEPKEPPMMPADIKLK